MGGLGINSMIGILLLVCAIQDIRKKKIFLWFIILGAILISSCVFFYNALSIVDIIGGVAIGAIVMVISIATDGKIGLGDGMLLIATGIGLGFWNNLELFAISLFMAAIVSIGLLILQLADRKKSIPFVPFLLLGHIVLIITDLKV